MSRLLALCALVLAVSACDSNDPDQSQISANSFVLSVEGDGIASGVVNRSQAYNGTFANDQDSQSFAILLGADPETSDALSADQPFLGFVREGGRPEIGSYPLPSLANFEEEPTAGSFVGIYVDPTQFVIPEDMDSFEIEGFYVTTGGTLTITRSSSTELIGSFSGTARSFSFMTGGFRGETIRFEGEFNAVPSDGFENGGVISGPTSLARTAL